jgi:hypothetical protein
MSDERHYATVKIAAAITGVSARTIRYWITSGKLPAVAGDSGKLVLLADVERLAGHRRQADGNGNVAEPSTVATAGDGATQQLEAIRDTLIKPHLETIERQAATIAEQAETVGRVTAERDVLQRRVDALEARQRSAQDTAVLRVIERDATPQTATGARQKKRQRRWWLRLFGVDE